MAERARSDTLRVDIGGVSLRNPVILAAGTAGYVEEMADAVDLSRVGAVVTKSITARPRAGNATWRIVETRHGGMLNAIGLANMGAEAFERDVAGRVAGAATVVIGSVAGFSVDDYVRVAAMFEGVGAIPAIELNLSCPNVHGGMEFGQSGAGARELVGAVRSAVKRLRVWVKLSPTAPDIVGVSAACIESGADALVLGNTIPAMAIDVETRAPRLSRGTGGLSGPAIHPVAVRVVHEVYRGVAKGAGVPIIGAGGVLRWEDAAEFMLAGASAIEMGTALFVDPRAPGRVARGLERWAARQGAGNIGELVGAVALEAQGEVPAQSAARVDPRGGGDARLAAGGGA